MVFLGGCFVYRPPICTGICLSFVRTDIPQKKQSVKPLKFQRYNLYSFLMLHRPPLPSDRKSPWNNENSRETCSPYTKQRSYMAVWVFLLASRRRAAKRVWIKTALWTSKPKPIPVSFWPSKCRSISLHNLVCLFLLAQSRHCRSPMHGILPLFLRFLLLFHKHFLSLRKI